MTTGVLTATPLPRRAAAMQRRREEILDAATRLLINAPERFSMRNLAAEASVSVRTIYNLVGEYPQLLTAVANRPTVGLLQQLRREQVGSAFDGLLLEVELIRKMDLRNDAGLAAIRALRLLDPSKVTQQIRAVMETDYLPDLRLAMRQGDLRDDVPPQLMVESFVTFTSQAIATWALDGDSVAYRERVARGHITTLLVAATGANRRRCLALLKGSAST